MNRDMSRAFPFTFVLLCVLLQGCVMYHRDRVVHEPSLATNVPRIERGVTTGTEILAWFGIPDVRAEGAEVILNAQSAMGQKRSQERVKYEQFNRNLEKQNRKSLFDPGWREKLARLEPYSSIDENHVAFLYLEYDSKMKGFVNPILIAAGGGRYTHLRNKLLVIIDKKTDIVVESSYREEFAVE